TQAHANRLQQLEAQRAQLTQGRPLSQADELRRQALEGGLAGTDRQARAGMITPQEAAIMRLHVLTGLNPLTLRAQQAQIAAQQEATRTRMGQNAELTAMRNRDGNETAASVEAHTHTYADGSRLYVNPVTGHEHFMPSPRAAAADRNAETATQLARREDAAYTHIASQVDHEMAEARRPPAAGQDARPQPEWLRQTEVTPGPDNTSPQRVHVVPTPEAELRDREIARRLATWRGQLGRANGGAQDLEGNRPGGQGGQSPSPSNGQAPPNRPQALAAEQFGSLLEETQGRLAEIRNQQQRTLNQSGGREEWQRLETTATPVWQEQNALRRIQRMISTTPLSQFSQPERQLFMESLMQLTPAMRARVNNLGAR
ncbi:MAG TPA: hypothetical protein VNX28_18175, partial [Gemmataceae bacterium]|nr:hypothetical protein [Gemmataceae bacterium]